MNNLANELIWQKNKKLKDSLYCYTQVNFSYHSNCLEGSHLTIAQTQEIYNKIDFKLNNISNDIVEAKNHFELFDFILDNVFNSISKEMILEMHKILKKNTNDNQNAGMFKTTSNVIGIVEEIKTVEPKDVIREVDNLLDWYNKIENVSLEDIIDFHVKFELIHPFNDGNGRVGRIIMFKECLKNNIMPFIILEEHKLYYLRGLKNYYNDKMYLLDTCKYSQDIYESVCKVLID